MLDVLPNHDLEILRVVKDLLARGQIIAVHDVHARLPFCEPDELAALSAAVLRIRRGGAEGPARVGIFAPRSNRSRTLRAVASSVREYLPSAAPNLMRRERSDRRHRHSTTRDHETELYALPCDSPYRPLWGALLGASTVLVHLGTDAIADDVTEALRDLDVRVVRSKAGFERPSGAIEVLREALGAASGSRLRCAEVAEAHAAPR